MTFFYILRSCKNERETYLVSSVWSRFTFVYLLYARLRELLRYAAGSGLINSCLMTFDGKKNNNN